MGWDVNAVKPAGPNCAPRKLPAFSRGRRVSHVKSCQPCELRNRQNYASTCFRHASDVYSDHGFGTSELQLCPSWARHAAYMHGNGMRWERACASRVSLPFFLSPPAFQSCQRHNLDPYVHPQAKLPKANTCTVVSTPTELPRLVNRRAWKA